MDETRTLLWQKIENFEDWFKFSYNLEEIIDESRRLLENYDSSIKINKNFQTLPISSYFEVLTDKNNNHIFNTSIKQNDKYHWKIKSNEENYDFYFDSQSEKQFAEILLEIKDKLKIWAKNYYPNSKIGFEYINLTKKLLFLIL